MQRNSNASFFKDSLTAGYGSHLVQGDHSPDNMKFSDVCSTPPCHSVCVTHTMSVLVLNTCLYANMQLTINSFRQHFPLTFSKINDISMTAVKFPDISRFSRQVVTLLVTTLMELLHYGPHTN